MENCMSSDLSPHSTVPFHHSSPVIVDYPSTSAPQIPSTNAEIHVGYGRGPLFTVSYCIMIHHNNMCNSCYLEDSVCMG